VEAPFDVQLAEDDATIDSLTAAPAGARLSEALTLASTSTGQDDDVVRLIDAASDYSEATLLARTAAGAFSGPVPPVPNELRAVKGAEFVFDSWNVTLSDVVAKRLAEIREARDAWINEMSDKDFQVYEAETQQGYALLRQSLAAKLGRAHDLRPGAGILEGPDGSIWRRKLLAPRQPRTELASGPPGGRAVSLHAESGPVASVLAGTQAGQILDAQQEDLPERRLDLDDLAADTKPVGQIVGTDQRDIRSRYSGEPMNTDMWGPNILLTRRDKSADTQPLWVECSGVKISPRIIITAGHCLFKNGSWNDNRRFIPGADGIGGSDPSPNGYDESQWRRARDEWVDHEWTNYDFGLLVLSDSSPFRCWWWRGWQENTSGLTGDLVYLYGYPVEHLDCSGANSPRSDGKCWGSIYGFGESVVHEGGYRFYYYIDTQNGQSGAGVYKISGSTRTVYGVNRGSVACCENDASRLNGGNTDHIQDAKSDFPASPC